MSSKRDIILSATQTLLAKHGFHGFSMKQLADKAGVAAGSIYNYFENKEDLILQLHLYILTDIAENTFQNFDSQLPLFEQYQHIWKQFWNYCIAHPEAVLCKDQFDHLPPKYKAVQDEKIMQLFAPLSRFFESGIEQELFKPLDQNVLSVLSIETAAILARKQLMELIHLTDTDVSKVIKASWDSIIV